MLRKRANSGIPVVDYAQLDAGPQRREVDSDAMDNLMESLQGIVRLNGFFDSSLG